MTPAQAEARLICVVNQRRSKKGLRPLKQAHELAKAADRHTRTMRRTDCFAHTCPGEPALSARLTKSGYLPCGCSWSAGENIAYGRGHKGSPRVIAKRWMQSSAHRQTLLNPGFRHVGVGFHRGTPYGNKRSAATYTIDLGFRH